MKGASGILSVAVLAAVSVHQAKAETLIERGTYLMNSIVACGNCHTPQGPEGPLPGRELAGGTPFDEVPFTAYASNLTPDRATGIGAWTDEQIEAAIREGRRPDGSLIGPPMPVPFYRAMSDRDLDAIVAYLRAVPPVSNKVPPSEYRIPLPASYGPPVGDVADVPRDDRLRYGAYLASIGHCMECHTPMTPQGPDHAREGAGGMPFNGPWGVSVSANITQDVETGLGAWTDDEIKTAITRGMRPDGTRLMPPMGFGYYANMADEDLDALVAWLRTVEPIHNAVR